MGIKGELLLEIEMRIEIVCGVGFDRDNEPVLRVVEKINWVIEEASRRFGGCNISQVRGGWLDKSGKLVIEPGFLLTIDGVSREKRGEAVLLASIVRDHFGQSNVVLNIIPEVETEFV